MDCRQALPSGPNAASILELVLLSLSDGVVVADQDGRVILVNPAAERLVSAMSAHGPYKPDGTTPFPPHELPLARAIRGEAVRDVEMFLRSAEGEEIWVSASATPLGDEASGLRGGVAVFRDIAARKRNEEALRKERDWAAAVVDMVAAVKTSGMSSSTPRTTF